MKATELRKRYLNFFKSKHHAIISGVSLIPENDPTVLFTTAGMHPLVAYLLGQKHPAGDRLVDVQKCIRTGDIEEVGDDFHLSFFEMLGNWSLGDYFKKEAIEYSFEFLTKVLCLDKKRLYITCFKGDKDSPKDTESAEAWMSLGISKERIFFLPKKDNWWGPAGKTGPCGPDTEMFYDTGKKACSKSCKPGCNCGKYVEIWNDVFMQYNKTENEEYVPLEQKNVDTGMGVERTLAILQNKNNVYETELFLPIIEKIKELSKNEDEKAIRIIADHIKAIVFLLDEKLVPSNLDQGYVLRRFIRRSIRYGRLLGIERSFLCDLAKTVIKIYPEIKNKDFIFEELKKEEEKFSNALEKALKKFDKLAQDKLISGKEVFILFSSYGLPMEMTKELAKEKGIKIDEKGYEKEYVKHQEISRKGAERRFRGGLADHTEKTTKLHTATHLLHSALRKVLGEHVYQRGSNITEDRLRFDFSNDRKLTDEELKKVEDLVNKQIKKGLEIKREELTVEEAKKKSAIGVFGERYGERVSVYSIGDFDIEICGGPHVQNTKELGQFKITKEESVASGVRRIKAILY